MSVADPGTADAAIRAVRRFNRFYTRQIGLLEEGLLKSRFSLAEVRVLYELANRDGLTAADLARELELDKGYLSRILRKFESEGLLARTPIKGSGRRAVLALSVAGRAAFAPQDAASHQQIAELLGPLAETQRRQIVGAITTIERLLGSPDSTAGPFLVRPPRSGDVGWIVHRHGVLYAEEYGWDTTFEGLVAEIAGSFLRNADPERERCWVAERHGAIVGSVFLMRGDEETAKLRLLYVEPWARGLGIGRRLVDECLSFARRKGYRTATLWTNDVLVSARRIYEAVGFKLVREAPHRSFGKELVGQDWSLSL